jgi:hypothetical protein
VNATLGQRRINPEVAEKKEERGGEKSFNAKIAKSTKQ